MKYLIRTIFIVAITLSTSLYAATVRYEMMTDIGAPTGGGYFSGFITLNSTDVFAGNTVSSSSIVDFEFTYGSVFTFNSSNSKFSTLSDPITIYNDLSIDYFNFCVSSSGNCDQTTYDTPIFAYSGQRGNHYHYDPITDTPLFSLQYQLSASDPIVGTSATPRNYLNWETSPVPISGAAWLFGSGLLGLIGFARRRKIKIPQYRPHSRRTVEELL